MPTRIVAPDYIYYSVFDIDYRDLWQQGIRVLCFDLENTLLEMGGSEFSLHIATLLNELCSQGFQLVFATNSLRDFSSLAKSHAAVVMQPTQRLTWLKWWKAPRKPERQFFMVLLDRLNDYMRQQPDQQQSFRSHDGSKCAMIGDKLVADVCGAQAVGMTGILINPTGPDMWIEQRTGLRRKENKHLRRLGITRA